MERPPIGLKPRNIYLSERMQEIKDAINRYLIASQPIPQEWITEYNELAHRVIK